MESRNVWIFASAEPFWPTLILLMPWANFSRVFNSGSGSVHAMQLHRFEMKLPNHGQTLVNRMIPGPSSQVEKWLCFCYLLMFLLSKQPSLKFKTRPKQVIGSLPLDIALPVLT